jgi:hypothetical protein
MTAELSDWLAELGEAQPAVAAEVGAGLVALLQCDDTAELADVGTPALPDPRQAVDSEYQSALSDLQLIRRGAARVATTRAAAERQLSARRAEGADPAELGTLEAGLASARQREAQLASQSQQIQLRVDAFRTAKETAKAAYTAAEAQLRVAEALAGLSELEEAELNEEPTAAESVTLRDAVRAAETRLQTLAGKPESPAAVTGLLELQADPLGTDIRILFAVEPASTVTLLAVLDGPEAISEHGAAALQLSGELLTEIREEDWPAGEHPVLLAGPDDFLARYFPGEDGSIARRADVLASVVPLARLREQQGLAISQVAARSGLTADRVTAIEQHGLRTARVHEAIALARALGARLELPGGSGSVAG